MAESITVNEQEPAHEWIGGLAHEADAGQLCPERYDWVEVRRLVLKFAENFKPSGQGELSERYNELRNETALSDREAEVVSLKELGMSHDAIAFYFAVLNEATTGDGDDYPTSTSTVDEYSRRAREKYNRARKTANSLESIYGE